VTHLYVILGGLVGLLGGVAIGALAILARLEPKL